MTPEFKTTLVKKDLCMKITINGQARELSPSASLKDIVSQFCQDERSSSRVITEHNGNIVKCAQWQDTPVKDGDTIELVSLVGGG
jgi:sulfur carrier protein